MFDHKFKTGDIIENQRGTYGEILLIKKESDGFCYFVDPSPGAEGNYEWIHVIDRGLIAGNWFKEKDLKLK